jgi:hypothetical protein
LADALQTLGVIALDDGDDARAEALFQESLAAMRTIGGVPSTQGWLGDLARRRGDLASAERHYREGLAIANQVRSDANAAVVLVKLAGARIAEGRAGEGVPLLAAGLAWREAHGFQNNRRLQRLVDADVAAGRDALGDRAFDDAWATGRTMEFRQAVGQALRAPDDEG